MNYLLEKFNKLKNIRFVADVTILAGGTAIAQIITIIFSPLITRIYGPESFGVLGVFIAIAALITPVASLAYSVAIVIPASDNDARGLVRLSLFIACFIALLIAFILGGWHNQIARLFGFYTSSFYLFFLPPIIIFTAAEQVFSQWLIRKKQFRPIALFSVLHTASINISKTGIGLMLATAPVLIVINALGQAFHTLLLWLHAKKNILNQESEQNMTYEDKKSSITSVAQTYYDYPIYRAPQLLIHNAAQNIPILLLAAFFGPIPAGFYALTRRVLKLPGVLIAGSVGKVFLPRIAEAAQRGANLRPMIVKAVGGLALIGLIPYGMVIAFGPWLFGFVFGAEWDTAGEYARWLALWLYFLFINVPCTLAIPLLGLQAQFLVYEVILIAVSTASLAFGALFLKSDISAVALFSISGAILNIVLLVWVFINSKDRLRKDLR